MSEESHGLFHRIVDAVTQGRYSQQLAEQRRQDLARIDEANRRLTYDVKSRIGESVRVARTSELSDERRAELEKVASGADEEGRFSTGEDGMTWEGIHQVAVAVSELQGHSPSPPGMRDKDEFVRGMLGFSKAKEAGKTVSPEHITRVPDYRVDQVKIGACGLPDDREKGVFQIVIAPFYADSDASADIADAVRSKIGDVIPVTDWVRYPFEDTGVENKTT